MTGIFLNSYDYLFKILLVGDRGTGKSELLFRLTDDIFNKDFHSTIGIDFKIKNFEIDGKIVKLQIWDTAGQESFKNIASSYYRGAHGVMLVFDVTNRASFEGINQWLDEVNKHCCDKEINKLIIGNKTDMAAVTVIDYSTAKEYADSVGLPYIETCTYNSENVERAFIFLATNIKNGIDSSSVPSSSQTTTIRTDTSTEQQKRSCY